MGRALGLRAARGEPFGGGLSGSAREQPATVGVGPARAVGGVLRGPRGTRTANGRGVRPLGSGTRLEPSSADRPDLGWVYDRAVVKARECLEQSPLHQLAPSPLLRGSMSVIACLRPSRG